MNTRLGIVFCLLACSLSSLIGAQDRKKPEGDERVYDLGDGVQPPRITRRVNPNYANVRGVSAQGSVAIALIVTSEGATKDLRVVKSLVPEVDRAAMDAVRQWRFAPAQKDGKAVAVRVTIELEFHAL